MKCYVKYLIFPLHSTAETIFASASLDGTVKLWKTDSLQVSRYFNSVNEEYQGPEKTFPYSVEAMTCIENVSFL